MKLKKALTSLMVMSILSGAWFLSGCAKSEKSVENVTIKIAAAASLENCFEDKLIPMFQKKNPNIGVVGTYDSSGKLQTQIEEGLDADIFMSAGTKQMDKLIEENLIKPSSVTNLLENKIVLIKTKGTEIGIKTFDMVQESPSIAIGDPASVPAGEYAQEIFAYIGNWEQIKEKASLGTNVSEVLSWVANGSAEIGVVYATDAASEDKVEIIVEVPENIMQRPVIYPVGALEVSKHEKEAELMLEFLKSEEAKSVFVENGFTIVK